MFALYMSSLIFMKKTEYTKIFSYNILLVRWLFFCMQIETCTMHGCTACRSNSYIDSNIQNSVLLANRH